MKRARSPSPGREAYAEVRDSSRERPQGGYRGDAGSYAERDGGGGSEARQPDMWMPRGSGGEAPYDRRRDREGPPASSGSDADRRHAGGSGLATRPPLPPLPPAVAQRPALPRGVDDRFVDDEDDEAGGDGREDGSAPFSESAASGSGGGAAAAPPLPSGPAPPTAIAPAFDIPEGEDEATVMARMMGFSGFDTTKGKEVADNKTTYAKGAVSRVFFQEARQYMHRKGGGKGGGFNRPLDAVKPITRK